MLTNKELLTAICESNGSVDEYLGDAVDEMGLNDTGGTVYGILDTVTADYSNLDLNASEIQSKLADPENMKLLKDVLTKLG